MFSRWFVHASGLLSLVVLVGCSGGNSGSFATVSGVVTQNGAPLSGAKVTFYSTVEAGNQGGKVCSAQTDSSGKYLIANVGKDPGLPPGMYKVTVTKLQMNGVDLPPDFDEGQMEASGVAVNALPRDYENVASTKLSVTLEAGKNENKDFALKGSASRGRITPIP